jgi:hypothetical protein
MRGRAAAVVVTTLMTLVAARVSTGGHAGASKVPAAGVQERASRFAKCAKKSAYEVVRPKPPNERAYFLRDEGFEFAEVDLEERPLLFFAAIVDFFPSRSDAEKARDRIGASLFGPSPVQIKNVVVLYTSEPGTSERKKVEKVVKSCLRR